MISLAIAGVLLTGDIGHDKYAHAGVSYGMMHSCQVITKKVTDLDKTESTIVCAIATLGAGAARELTGNKDPDDMAANAVGVGLATIMISIDF
jgi:hypothetical protein